VAHAALAAGRSALELGSVAQARLQALGAAAEGPWLEPAGAWLADRLEGEPLGVAVSRLYFARLWPRAREAARREARWRSPLIQTPARALLARAIVESAGSRGVAALLALLVANPPGTLDSLCRLARVDPRAVESRYAATADSLARAFEPARRAGRPTPWRPGDGFQRGVCLAHSVSLERGYLSAACGRQLESLRRMGANWVSLTPFGYLPDPAVPELLPSGRGGTDGETDQAVCEAAARARALGLRVWLAPHLWARGWTGELEFGAGGWPKFFERYREFILHYALLAERERMDGLVVGHELVSATLRFPDRWQALIAEVRRVYSGTLGYEANWGEEVRGIGFWDALDVVGVSFYDPLASGPTRSPGALGAGARKALDGLRVVGARAGRPVVLLEAGYPAHARAPIEPWVEPPGPADPEMQRLCYEALVQALEPDTWVAGVFFWKWPSSGEGGGPRDPSFTPRGKPAEQVMRRALESWRGRPVRVPRR
jgi:hypothetical protein